MTGKEKSKFQPWARASQNFFIDHIVAAIGGDKGRIKFSKWKDLDQYWQSSFLFILLTLGYMNSSLQFNYTFSVKSKKPN